MYSMNISVQINKKRCYDDDDANDANEEEEEGQQTN